jgi:AraC-like DNA-binding protein
LLNVLVRHYAPDLAGLATMLLEGGKTRPLAGARTRGFPNRAEVIEDTTEIDWEQRVYPASKIAHVVDALSAEGAAPAEALRGTEITVEQLRSPSILVSLNQVVECYRNALRLARDPHFAFRTGLKTHVSLYGMYGFAILSSMNFRETMLFAVRYHQLAIPLVRLRFSEEPGSAIWTIDPLPHPAIDARLYRFIVELQFGVHAAMQRDVMGPAFHPRELQVTYDALPTGPEYEAVFGCPVAFRQSANRFLFDAAWLDRAPRLGNEIAHSAVLALCDDLHDRLRNRMGLAGKVRGYLLANLGRRASLELVAGRLGVPARTLRRKLRDEQTSFREIVDQLRAEVAIKYLRDTRMTIDDIAKALGFSETANFRHAFRRWKRTSPLEYRRRLLDAPIGEHED